LHTQLHKEIGQKTMQTNSILATIITTIIVVSAFVIITPIHQSTASTLTTTTGTITRQYHQTGFGVDLGLITFVFASSGVTWTDNWVPSTTFNYHISTWNGVTLTPTLSQNTTTIDYHYSGTVSSRTLTADMYLTQNGYNYKIAIIGTLSGSATTIPLVLTFPTSSVLTGTQICVNHLCFDFGDSLSYNPTYNPTTGILTFTIGNSFTIDPFAIDKSSTCGTNLVASSCTASIKPSTTSDVIFALETSAMGDVTPTATGLTFHPITPSPNNMISSILYYAVSASSSAVTITCKFSSIGAYQSCLITSIQGANTSTIFDTYATPSGVPCSGGIASGTSVSCTSMIQSYTNAMVLAFTGCDGISAITCPSTPTIGSSCAGGTCTFSSITSTVIGSSCSTHYCSGVYAQYYSSTNPNLSPFTVLYSGLTNGGSYDILGTIVFALNSNYETRSTSTTTTTSTPATTISTSTTITSYSPTVPTTTTLTSYSPTIATSTTTTYTSWSPTTPTTTTITSYSPTVTSTYTSYSPTVTSTIITTTGVSGGNGSPDMGLITLFMFVAVFLGFGMTYKVHKMKHNDRKTESE